MENDDSHDAAQDLASLDAATAGYATAMAGEGCYHVALGVGVGAVVTSQGLASPWSWILPLVFLATLPLFIGWWRRSHGWWVSGYGPARTRWVVALMVVAYVGLSFVSFAADSVWVSAIMGAITAVVVAAAGFVWMFVWRRGLTAADAG
ncbi:hypothetical protein [Microbacterium murale]|uniref:Uncharacterized protein n=1 Tax=Microbacterium murale TaxID=1081040 RepID=A0ABQ1RRS7_9MICO|nr:hypothetical protein [Microbacterium murale]GGD78990.1 hypothetical protein GCM10007269_22300 [Microbacterium murale]